MAHGFDTAASLDDTSTPHRVASSKSNPARRALRPLGGLLRGVRAGWLHSSSALSVPAKPGRPLAVVATLLALAAGVLLTSTLPVQAQAKHAIEYPENVVRVAVARFTATDPENAVRRSRWSLSRCRADAERLRRSARAAACCEFKPRSPDYEMPMRTARHRGHAVRQRRTPWWSRPPTQASDDRDQRGGHGHRHQRGRARDGDAVRGGGRSRRTAI